MPAPAVERTYVAATRRIGTVRAGGGSRFRPLVPEIVAEVLMRIEADLPGFASASWRSRTEDEAFLTFETIRQLELCEQDVDFTEADLLRLGSHFTALARRGAPLPAVQRFCRSAVVDIFGALWARAEPADLSALLRFSRWHSRNHGTLERLMITVGSGEPVDGHRPHGRRVAMAERLLAGMGEQASSEPGDPPVAPSYLVVVLSGTGDPSIRDLPGTTLLVPVEGRYHLLLAVDSTADRPRVWEEVAGWVATLGERRAAGAFASEPSRVPAAAAAAGRLVDAAAAVGLPAMLVGEREMALELALAAHPHRLARVAGVLERLESGPYLVETLAVFFAHDLDRKRAASALGLSRGGLSLRLDRVSRLTGLDPRSTRGVQVLGAALSARALIGAHRPHAS